MRRKTKILLVTAILLLGLSGGLGPRRHAQAAIPIGDRTLPDQQTISAPPASTDRKKAEKKQEESYLDNQPNGGCPTMF